ncbi:DUF932 domain-containing protein [Streptacidiphilus cavernicola]|uniref:DUF932 domain-containing protein n=1 Tax=Streptacidiphilus cavernicola TaxID=3342716 RepID=A0ABV6VYB0_9ACTN
MTITIERPNRAPANEPLWNTMSGGSFTGTWAEARQSAGLTWEPIDRPVWDETIVIEDGVPGVKYVEIPESKQRVRSDTGKRLGVVNTGLAMINHDDIGEILEAIGVETRISWRRLGELQGGKKIWALADLGESRTVLGDFSPQFPHLLVTAGHTGGAAFSATTLLARYDCANVIRPAQAAGKKGGRIFTIRHTKNWRSMLEAARLAVHGARAEFDTTMEVLDHLALQRVDAAAEEQFVQRFFPLPPEHERTVRKVNGVETRRVQLRSLLASPTNDMRPSAYKLVQGAVEWSDHVQWAKNAETRFTRSLVDASPHKIRAVNLARDIARDFALAG